VIVTGVGLKEKFLIVTSAALAGAAAAPSASTVAGRSKSRIALVLRTRAAGGSA
jgi:hypothetical protein